MGIWKAVGYAVIGVGAVAAAPFTGGGSLLGAASLAGSLAGAGALAAAAGATGAVVGAMSDDESEIKKKAQENKKRADKSDRKAEKSEAENVNLREQKKELNEKNKILNERINGILSNQADANKYFDAIVAIFSVGVSVANCDGHISSEELSDIHDFISIIGESNIPLYVNEKIMSIYQNPLNISEAFELAKNSCVPMRIFDEFIQMVIDSDNVVHANEKVFIQSWNSLKMAA